MTSKKADLQKKKQVADVKMTRKQAAEYIESTYGTLSTWATKGKHEHLKPFKQNGIVYYWKSNLDYHLDLQLKK